MNFRYMPFLVCCQIPSTGGGVTTDPEGHVFNITVEDNDGKVVKDKLSVKVAE